jgi:cytochrome o ubiquinol oxidase subunit 1
VLPQVAEADTFWATKQRARTSPDRPAHLRRYKPIEMPKNSPIGFINAFFAVVTGFALIWHIWWMAGVGAIGIFLTMLAFAFRDEEEIEVPAEQIARFEQAYPVEIAV